MSNCQNCGAPVRLVDSVCPYCHTANRGHGNVDEKKRSGILSVAQAMDEVLKDNSDHIWLGPIFIVLAVLAVGAFFLFRELTGTSVETWIFTAIFSFALFVFFGFLVGLLENRQLNKIYNSEVRPRIDDYLEHHGVHRYSFDEIAEAELPPKSLLRKFLFKQTKYK